MKDKKDGMKYEKLKSERKTNMNRNDSAVKEMNRLSTSVILWHLIKKHRFALVSAYAIIMTMLVIMPAFPTFIMSLVNP